MIAKSWFKTTFTNEIKMFNLIFKKKKFIIDFFLKVWDADIINPSPAYGNKYVNNVTSVEVDEFDNHTFNGSIQQLVTHKNASF